MNFIIEGRPVPYTRMTKRSKWVDKAAIRYLGYKDMVGVIGRKYFKQPSDKPIRIKVDVYLFGVSTPMGKDGDTTNYVKAIEDGLNKIAYLDDRQIIEVHGRKMPCEKKIDERVEITIEEINAT